jgi:hypothetical protein
MMSRFLWRMLVLLAPLLVHAPAGAAARFSEVGGHFSIGYAKLSTADGSGGSISPGGSISMGAGLDYPLTPRLRAGLDLGYELLGSLSFQRGSLLGAVDYSALEVTAFVHWLPQRGLVRRVSLGPALVNGQRVLSVTGGGAGAAQITLMKAKPAPVKLGLELGGRLAFLAGDDWTLLSVRATVHY